MLGHTGLTCVAHVCGGGALALTLSQLHGADIWARTDLPHSTTTLSHHAIALGGARILVLDQDADDARALLAANPAMISSSIRGWRILLFLVFLFNCGAPCSPSAVFVAGRTTQYAQV